MAHQIRAGAILALAFVAVTAQGCSGGTQETTKQQIDRVNNAANEAIDDVQAGGQGEAAYLQAVEPDREQIAVASGLDPAVLTDADLLRSGYAMCELITAGDATWEDLRANAEARGGDPEAVRIRLVIIDAAQEHLCSAS